MTTSGFVHPEFLVETDWLADHLADPDVLVFDCTTHLIPDPKTTYPVVPGVEDFKQGHIPGAQFIDMLRDVSDTSQRLRFMRQAPDEFAVAMRRLGVNGTSRVVTYSTANPWWATRMWWLLRVFGHDNAAVLNGGWQKWSREGRPSEVGVGQQRPAGDFSVREVRDLMVDKSQVLAAIGDGGVCTLNALLPQQHAGIRRQLARAAGAHRGERHPAGGTSARSGYEHVPAGRRTAQAVCRCGGDGQAGDHVLRRGQCGECRCAGAGDAGA